MVLALDGDAGTWGPVVRLVPFMLGLVIFTLTFGSLVRTMVIPRNKVSVLYALIIRSNDFLFRGLMRLRPTFAGRDRILAWSGAMGIIIALIVWLMFFLLAYALMIFGVSNSDMLNSLLQAGSGLFTLGLIGTPGQGVTIVDFVAAMTGPAVIALLIGFLPTLYQAYLGREARVLLAAAVTGAPAWGPELLCRTQLLEGDNDLPENFEQWSSWAAQVRLSQTLYPALNRFRSPAANRNWLVSLIAVMDAAALRLAICSGSPDKRTVGLLEEGGQAILSLYATERDIRQALPQRRWKHELETTLAIFGVTRHSDDLPAKPASPEAGLTENMVAVARAVTTDNLRGRLSDSQDSFHHIPTITSNLTRAEFDYALDLMRRAGVKIERDPDKAFEIFTHERGRYEHAACNLAQMLYAPRAPWTGPRKPDTPVMWPSLAVDQLPHE